MTRNVQDGRRSQLVKTPQGIACRSRIPYRELRTQGFVVREEVMAPNSGEGLPRVATVLAKVSEQEERYA